MVDEERVIRLLERVVADVTFLADFAHRPPEELLRDELAMSAVKYRFVTAIEGCVKVAHHLAVAEGWSAPETNAEALRELGRRGVVSPELALASRPLPGSGTCWCTSTPTSTTCGGWCKR